LTAKVPHFVSILLRAALPLVILGAGWYAFSVLSIESEEEKSPPEEERTLRTRVAEAEIVDYPVVIKTQGTVMAHNEITLSARVSGQITRISPAFEAGSYFTEGDVLIQLDPTDYKTSVDVAEAQLLISKSAVEIAERDYEAFKELFSRDYISQTELDRYIAANTQATASLESARARLEQAKRDLERTTIIAPFSGRVRQKFVGEGQSIGSGTPLGVVFAVDDGNEDEIGPEITVFHDDESIRDGDTTPLFFGSVPELSDGPRRTFEVFNEGDRTLEIGRITLPAGFRIIEGLVDTLEPNASDSFTVERIEDHDHQPQEAAA